MDIPFNWNPYDDLELVDTWKPLYPSPPQVTVPIASPRGATILTPNGTDSFAGFWTSYK